MPEFDRVAVVGCGTTGSGIAQVAAQAGCQVTVVEVDPHRLEEGMEAIRTTVVPERVRGTASIADLADAQLVIEAVGEDREAKRSLIGQIVAAADVDAVLVTSTAVLSVSDLASASERPGQFAGLHFFDPVPSTAIVEVVAALQTSDDVIGRLSGFVSELGKTPVAVKDRPGFLINRLLMPYLNDVVQAYDDGLATAEDLDTAIRLGLGYKQGPLEMLDAIGLDVHENATRSAYEALRDPVYAPPPLLRAMVAAGRHGNKNGNGFRNQEERA